MKEPSPAAEASSALVAGRDYPAHRRDFDAWFPDEEACRAYLERLRWPEGFWCAVCGVIGEPWRQSRGRLVCRACRHQATVTAGTIFDKSRTPLRTWFEAGWQLVTSKNGVSALSLAETLGVTYQVAWPMLHRYRVAMVRMDRDPLFGEVEVDETFVGGVDHGAKRGRGAAKCIVVVAIELVRPRGFGRVRLRHVPDASGDSLVPFVCDSVAPGSVVLTDAWGGYNELAKHPYTHNAVSLSASPDPAHVVMPGVHRVASLLKRWILGTHQGSVDPVHLQAYLEEFTFRFNRRTSRSRGLVFCRLLEQAVVTGPVTEAEVLHGYLWEAKHKM
ncbi:MAG: IS1595 family transposase [Actinomycetota bacterium]|nr:IS1595 family transposase [Actinomycetota bacterium]